VRVVVGHIEARLQPRVTAREDRYVREPYPALRAVFVAGTRLAKTPGHDVKALFHHRCARRVSRGVLPVNAARGREAGSHQCRCRSGHGASDPACCAALFAFTKVHNRGFRNRDRANEVLLRPLRRAAELGVQPIIAAYRRDRHTTWRDALRPRCVYSTQTAFAGTSDTPFSRASPDASMSPCQRCIRFCVSAIYPVWTPVSPSTKYRRNC
jgi:hypothetical protein